MKRVMPCTLKNKQKDGTATFPQVHGYVCKRDKDIHQTEKRGDAWGRYWKWGGGQRRPCLTV